MDTGTMFEKATRMKLRFPYKGMATVEDLWDLSTKELDEVYKVLRRRMKASEEESLLGMKSTEDAELSLQVGIIKHIVETKLDESRAKVQEMTRNEQKRKIGELIESKKNEALAGKSLEELESLLKNL